ncbi:phosphoribosyltransferase domain-containing protein [Paeniglutamicibacter kerguelensis]|uniref:Adenine/guanine phosphoribosyltransferase-like PRPP-binding protein n=1 Tax=Paeniglutamicibacter kerguelensis TaxID=254788 RepID=A0ABS4XIG7_9MICC|nr:phosphoribosyltransferase domain-containing protein [Paeniglutamicibacter kerguelensis]MBP2388203.1 adenine/guanine phosphoribosyltransferase-like PRPP-binding protein [Paeniglutamicibacter kerguelensis]
MNENARGAVTAHWKGAYVSDALGVGIATDVESSLFDLRDLTGLALRRNPKRAHLLVSSVLGKHQPSDPSLVIAAGELLGSIVAGALDGTSEQRDCGHREVAALLSAALRHDQSNRSTQEMNEYFGLLDGARALLEPLKTLHPEVVSIGYAETATGLGRLVAGSIGSYYIHSTRHVGDGTDSYRSFEEEHSHATSHRMLPHTPDVLASASTIVLVDDELSTGATVINTIRALHSAAPQANFVVASLIDVRGPADRQRFTELAEDLGTNIVSVALGCGSVLLPDDVLAKAATHLRELMAGEPTVENALSDFESHAPGSIDVLPCMYPGMFHDRYGSPASATSNPLEGLRSVAKSVLDVLPQEAHGKEILVLGTEEFLHVPLMLSDELSKVVPAGTRVLFSSTTRSPIVPLDRGDYAINSVLNFSSHDDTMDGPGPRHAYNIAGARRFAAIIVAPEPGTPHHAMAGPGGLLEALASASDHVLVVAAERGQSAKGSPGRKAFPKPLSGPDFGSYGENEVAWLLKDLSGLTLEAPTADREQAVQSGAAHYSESLPEEYVPSQDYLELFDEALERSSAKVATAIGVVSELALTRRGGKPVLVSLARAGTPVGILMRRWLKTFHDIDVPHYAVSIVRGRGIDTVAMEYLADKYGPERILFVDGWTGKGAISRELKLSLEKLQETHGLTFDPELAVLADPGHCTTLFGTREDYLIPSACLNSTVSGLVSRTVLNGDYIGPEDFHGAKFYSQLAGADQSARFLDAVTADFSAVRQEAQKGASGLANKESTATWEGWSAVQRIGDAYGISNPNLIKPGVGETTRVLLRRMPWKVLVRPEAVSDLGHILLLAQQRNVEVVEVPGLEYSCVGLIKASEVDA